MSAVQFVLAYLAAGVVVYALARYQMRHDPESMAPLDTPLVAVVTVLIWPLMLVLIVQTAVKSWRDRRAIRRALRMVKRIARDADRPDLTERIDAFMDKVNES